MSPWVLLSPFLATNSRTYWVCLVISGLVALLWSGRASVAGLWQTLRHPSFRLDVQLMLGNTALKLLGVIPELVGAMVLARTLVRSLDGAFGAPNLPTVPSAALIVAHLLSFFVVWDVSRYVFHRLMHRIPALWELHQVHHSAEVLNPLTIHRTHFVESALIGLRNAAVTGLVAGVFHWLFRTHAMTESIVVISTVGIILNGIWGNLRHSHIYIRFGRWERVFVSPAQHQLHHADDPAHYDVNFGVWFSLWDRLGGTWKASPEVAPTVYGLGEARNHGTGLLSAYLHPLLAAARTLTAKRSASAAAAIAVLGMTNANAQDPYEIVVRDDDGVPAVAGSATVLDEADLERFEYDDIHAHLAEAPGVYTRGEDGFGLRPNIGIRGASSERSAKVMLLEDGVPSAPAPYAAPAAYYFPMSTRLVGLEVFKGAGATQYGPQTVGGALNMRTRNVPTSLTGGLDLAAGIRNTVKLHAWTGIGDDDSGLLVEAVHLATDGFKDLVSGGPTGFNRSEFMLKGQHSWQTGDTRHTLALKLGLSLEDSNETYLGLLAADADATPYARYAASELDHMQWFRTQAELSYTVRSAANVDIHTTAYHHYLDRAWFKLNRFADGPDLHGLLNGTGTGRDAVYLAILRGEANSVLPGDALLIGTNDRQYHSMGVQSRVRIRGSFLGEPGALRTELGLRVHGDIVDRLHTEDPHAMTNGTPVRTEDPRLTNTDTRASAIGVAAHALTDMRLGSWHISPSVRVENVLTQLNDRQDPTSGEKLTHRVSVLPGLGVRVEATPTVDLFMGAHRGFSPVAPGQAKDVRPESSWNGELGARWASGDRGAELVLFGSDYTNLVGACTFAAGCADNDVGLQFNGGQVRIGGVESSYSDNVPLAPGLSMPIQANYTLTAAAFQSDFVSAFPQFGNVQAGDQLPYVPTHQAHARVGLTSERVGVDVGATARSVMRDSAGQNAPAEVRALFTLDAAAHVDVDRHITLYTTLTNALGATTTVSLRPFGSRPTAPRQVMFGVKIR
ncbi:MAG: Fe(3+) dicitrate transport protein [Myxococcota bacterium]|jgi:Fe(3+) dicitrate transport protein